MSQPDEHDGSLTDGPDPTVLPTRTGGWTPARPAATTPVQPPTPERPVGPAQWAPHLSPAATPPPVPVPTPAWPVSASVPADPTPPDPTLPDPTPADDDPDRLRPDELPWGIPARALVGAGGNLPPPTLVARRRSPTAVIRLVALGLIAAALVVVAAIALTR